jgi:hypothetical protein
MSDADVNALVAQASLMAQNAQDAALEAQRLAVAASQAASAAAAAAARNALLTAAAANTNTSPNNATTTNVLAAAAGAYELQRYHLLDWQRGRCDNARMEFDVGQTDNDSSEKVIGDVAWLLRSAISVISMQGGFALLEAGSVRSTSQVSVLLAITSTPALSYSNVSHFYSHFCYYFYY